MIPRKRPAALKYPIRLGSITIWLTEEGLCQFAVADWLRVHKIKFLHVPNEGKRSIIEGVKLKLFGLDPGASDFLIFTPSPKTGRPTAIELKQMKGSKPTDKQVKFLEDRAAEGWNTTVAFGSDAAIQFLQSLGYGGNKWQGSGQ